MVKVSVIVPVYNTEKFLGKCLESIVQQTLNEIEIIIINDGSTDNSQEIINKYKLIYDKKIKVILKENEGQAIARNIGMELASGEYIGFIDSDDFIEPDMFEKMYEEAKIKNADMVMCHYRYLLNEDNQIKELKKYSVVKDVDHVKELFLNPLVSPWNKIYKNSIIKDSGVKFPPNLIYEDTAFYINIIPYLNNIAFIPKEYVTHMLRRGSTVNRVQNPRVGDMLEILAKIVEFYKANGFWNEYKEELEYFCVKILLCSSLKRVAILNDKDIKNNLIDKSIEFINNNFKNYKNNQYMKKVNITNIYIKSFNKYSLNLYLILLKLLNIKK